MADETLIHGYPEEVWDEILERIADGESLKAICQSDGMPRKTSVFKRLTEDKDFANRYAHAREAQADALADEIAYIADNPVEGEREETTTGPQGTSTKVIRADMTDHRRLQIDARKWIAAKLKPKKYGDLLKLGGEDGAAPIGVTINKMLLPEGRDE